MKTTLWCILTPLALAMIYLLGYGAYRIWGPIQVHYPKDGTTGGLMASIETPTREALYQLYQPCIALEDRWRFGSR